METRRYLELLHDYVKGRCSTLARGTAIAGKGDKTDSGPLKTGSQRGGPESL